MKKAYYLFNPGRMSRKDHTLKFEPVAPEGGAAPKPRYLPVSGVSALYMFGSVDANSAVYNFLGRQHIPVHFFDYYQHYTGTFSPREHLLAGQMVVAQTDAYRNKKHRPADRHGTGGRGNVQHVEEPALLCEPGQKHSSDDWPNRGPAGKPAERTFHQGTDGRGGQLPTGLLFHFRRDHRRLCVGGPPQTSAQKRTERLGEFRQCDVLYAVPRCHLQFTTQPNSEFPARTGHEALQSGTGHGRDFQTHLGRPFDLQTLQPPGVAGSAF